MAAEQELVAPFEVEIKVHPRIKVEEDPTDCTFRVNPEGLRLSGEAAAASSSKAIQTQTEDRQKLLWNRRVKQESEEEPCCFLGGDRLLSGSEQEPAKAPCVKAEWVEDDSEGGKRKAGKCGSQPTVAERGQFQEVGEQPIIIGGEASSQDDPCRQMLVNPPRKTPHQPGFPNCGESVDDDSKLITPQGEKPHTCSESGQCKFSQSPPLTSHQRFHPGGSMMMCQSSSSKGSAQCWVSRTRQQRQPGTPHQCANCGKSFQYKSQLIRHQRVHTGERPYPCSDCGKSFSQRHHLLDHQKLHSGTNPHRCSDCGKSFSYVSQLLAHERSHTGEKPFPCLVCAQRFSRRTHLHRHHMKLHSREKYIC